MTTGRHTILAFGLLSMLSAACNNNTPSSPDYSGTGGNTSAGGIGGGGGNGTGVGNGGSGGNESVGGQTGTWVAI
jgi:hypothetical protein